MRTIRDQLDNKLIHEQSIRMILLALRNRLGSEVKHLIAHTVHAVSGRVRSGELL